MIFFECLLFLVLTSSGIVIRLMDTLLLAAWVMDDVVEGVAVKGGV